ncbi:SDR family NAD(P)-dependent oxidoreductase [Nocardia sp. NPDC019395]|uniref:SDR family NAD(P)-dependent oxidoreductase n=1 Tax=Nocardia sp. NPDC019395 TaxID=3154686 RepID=UPI0033F458C6
MTTARVWFITGASRGLGRAFAEAALAAGDRVVAVARNIAPLDDLVAAYPHSLVRFSLDISDRRAVFDGAERAFGAFGRVDIVVNNAGGMLYGMAEEATEEQIRAHFDVNFFGAVWVSQAVVPRLRAQGGGRILQVTSMGSGGGMASVGFYGAGKAALESFGEALAMEVESFGIDITNLQMGGYDTGLFSLGTTATDPFPPYDPLRAELAEIWGDDAGPDPATAVATIMELVALPHPPRRLIVGSRSYEQVRELDRARDRSREEWEYLSCMAPG